MSETYITYHQKNNKDIFAVLGIVLGVINLFSWIFPICGFPLTIIGLVLGAIGVNSNHRTLAIVAIVLSGLGLFATMGNSLLGVFLAVSNQ